MRLSAPVILFFAAASVFTAASCGRTESPDAFLVGAAASTAEAVEGALMLWSDADGEAAGEAGGAATVAASSTLARQIERGAPIDVFVSANLDWANHVASAGADAPVVLARNRVVLVAETQSGWPARIGPESELPLAFVGAAWSTGDPAHVPIGAYAQAAFESLGWWARLDENLVPATDVRAGLRLLELREVSIAICYASDVAESERVRSGEWTVVPLDDDLYPAAVVVGVLCEGARPAARRFFHWLQTDEGARVWRAHGFETERR